MASIAMSVSSLIVVFTAQFIYFIDFKTYLPKDENYL